MIKNKNLKIIKFLLLLLLIILIINLLRVFMFNPHEDRTHEEKSKVMHGQFEELIDAAANDGTSNQTAQVQHIIDYAIEHKINKIKFPKNLSLKIDEISILGNNIEIDLNGCVLSAQSPRLGFISITGSNIKFYNYKIQGNDIIQRGIIINSTSKNIEIANGTIKDIYSNSMQKGSFGIFSSTAENVKYNRNKFQNIRAEKDGNIGNENGVSRGIYIGANPSKKNQISVKSNKFDGVNNVDMKAPEEDSDCLVINSSGAEIARVNAEISGNSFAECGKRFIKLMYVQKVKISYNTSANGIKLMYSAISLYSCKSINIEDNNFETINVINLIDIERSNLIQFANEDIRILRNEMAILFKPQTSMNDSPSFIRIIDPLQGNEGRNKNITILNNKMNGAPVAVYAAYVNGVNICNNRRYNGQGKFIIVTEVSGNINIKNNEK